MLYDIILSTDGGGFLGLYCAPYCSGPNEGEFFKVAPESLSLRKAVRVYSGVQSDSPLWGILEELYGEKIKRIYSKVDEWVMKYSEEEA